MIQAFFLSLGQLFDRPILAVFVKSVLVTFVALILFGAALWYLLGVGLPAFGELLMAVSASPEGAGQPSALGLIFGAIGATLAMTAQNDVFASVGTIVIFLLLSWLLFRAIAVAVIGIFADEVVAAVEKKHYPGAHAQAIDVPLGRSIAMGLGSAVRLLAINLLLSPLYLILLVTGVGTALAFFLVNSWLLGRDLGDMVAARHMPRGDLRGWRRRTSFGRFTLGAVGTGLLLVPILNLVAPVLGAAMATHAFHRGRRAQ